MSTQRSGRGNGHPDRLTHVDEHGKAHMVDVTGKPVTARVAEARCLVRTTPEVARAVTDRETDTTETDMTETDMASGLDLLESARLAGIMAAKQTASLVPLCHPLRIDGADVDIVVSAEGVRIRAVVSIVDRTGVEIEALTACTVAALVVIQPIMALDSSASIEELTVWHKSGGRSGTWRRTAGGGVESDGAGGA